MNYKGIYKILPWLVLLLLATNTGTLISLVSHLKQKPATELSANPQGKQIPEIQRTSYFADKLGLDMDQQDQFRELNQGFNRQANRIKADMDFSRQELINELGKSEPDELILSNLAKDVGILHTELKMITIDFFLGIKKICNPEQSEELLELFQNLIQNDQTPGGRRGEGRGQGQGRRYGWGHSSSDDKSASEK